MNPPAQSYPEPMRISLATPAAAIEILTLFGVVAVASLGFVTGWLTPNQAAVLTALLLIALLGLAWRHLNQGRHPCFLFLSMLLLLQGGRLLTYCLGSEPDPLRVRVQTAYPFDLSRGQAGVVLLCLALSAICVYAPCRWNCRSFGPPSAAKARRYLPYLYWLFYGSVPIQIFKNYAYYQYAQQHGGYVYFWVNHGDFAASVPLWVRLVSLATLPAFLGIFILETRKKYLYLATFCYFGSSLLLLLLGARMGTLALIVVLWYAAGIKSGKKSRAVAVIVLALILFAVAGVFQSLREENETTTYAVDPLAFIDLAGNSLDVTEVAVKYRDLFAPYAGSYLWNELQNAFVPQDYQHYFRGRVLNLDISEMLNPAAFANGTGTGGSYVGEEYVIGGITAVILISLLIGCMFHLLYRLSHNVFSLFFVLMLLPDFLAMPRANLLDWLSVLARTVLFVLVLAVGWMLYSLILWLKHTPRATQYSISEQLSGA